MCKRGRGLALGLLVLLGNSASANNSDNSPSKESRQDIIGIPFIFSSEDWGVAIGGAGVVKGLLQPQMTLFGMAIASNNDSSVGFLGLYNVMVPNLDQLRMDFSIYESIQTNTRIFLPGNPDFAMEQPGSNDSSLANYIRDGLRDKRYQIDFKYTLPIGAGKDGALVAMAKKYRGYESSTNEWNPMTTGITTLELRPFYHSQRLDQLQPGSEADHSAGVRVKLEYDNRNSANLPTRGSKSSFTYTWDWGNSDRPSWSMVELEYSKFFNLGSNSLMRQQVLGLNAWVADTPSWNQTEVVNGQSVYRRPPWFAGINLGGWDKLRGFSSDRFYGRSAVSYSLEYRVMPHWQPLAGLPIIGSFYDIPWWQWTLFADIGRVADNFNLLTLHQDMKTSVGGGIRFQIEGLTVRTEIALGSEERFLRIFVNQPF